MWEMLGNVVDMDWWRELMVWIVAEGPNVQSMSFGMPPAWSPHDHGVATRSGWPKYVWWVGHSQVDSR